MSDTRPTLDQLKHYLPQGRLRAAINYGNGVLVQRQAQGHPPKGVAFALATAFAEYLGVELEPVFFESAGEVVNAVDNDVWDVAFLAIDPKRAERIAYTAPYVIIEGSYLVKQDSPVQHNADLDQAGTRIAVGKGAAYDLFLSRTLKNAELVRAATTPGAVDLFIEEALEAAAGVRGPLLRFAEQHPEYRVVDGCFMSIEQAMALPIDKAFILPFLSEFIETRKANGFVANELKVSQQHDAQVGPLAEAQ
jgi:polar amino acid transport system substrate-binding protein